MRGRVWLITLVSLMLALVLGFDLVPFLRGGYGWQWPYAPESLTRVLPFVFAALVYLTGAWLLSGRSRGVVVWSFVGAVALPLAALLVRSDDMLFALFARTVSGQTTGQHLAGATIDWSNWLNWPQTVAPFAGRSGHIVLSGPGLPLWYATLNATLDSVPALADPLQRALVPWACRNYDLLAYTPGQWASAWFGMLMPVWAALAVGPLFAVCKRLAGEPAARLAASWWPLVPALVLFAPTWNTVYPLLALIAFGWLLRGLESARSGGWLIAAGLLSGLLTFANFSLLPLLGFFGCYTLLNDLWVERRRWQRPVLAGVWFGAGLIVPWLIYGLASGLTPFDLLSFAMSNHLILDRPYLPWLWLHSWEWALLTGIPLIALWLLATIRPDKREPLAPALALTLLILILSGTARGETGRVWLFFAPFALISAATWLTRLADNTRRAWLVVSAGQLALLLALLTTWDVINAPDMLPPPTPPGSVIAGRPAGATIANTFRLAGWDAQVQQNSITLALNWEPLKAVTTPYWFAALLVAPDGSTPQEPVVWQALDTRYPTTCWQPGQIVGDTIDLPLPGNAQSGDWWISLSLFGDRDDPENRLMVALPDGATDNQLGLGPVTVR